MRIHQFLEESIARNLSGICIDHGRDNGKEIMIPDLEDWKYGSIRKFILNESTPRKIDQTKSRDEFTGTGKLSGRGYEFREPNLRRENAAMSEHLRAGFHGERKSLNLHHLNMRLKLVSIFGGFKVTSSIAITMNLEFNFVCRKKKHSLFHRSFLM